MAKKVPRRQGKRPKDTGPSRGRSATRLKVVPRARSTAQRTAAPPAAHSETVIVGVGASAGGLEAFSQLLKALPRDPDLALVLVQHLAPKHESALPMLLSARTNLEVVQAVEGIRVEPNHVYVIPPNIQMGINQGRLHLTPRPTDRSQYNPIDYFLRSLAESVQDKAICVILSGTASDGSLGVRDVKAVGGITIAQKPDTAKYDGMPSAAIATGLVDLVLPPAKIARELARISAHPLRRPLHVANQPERGGVTVAPRDEDLGPIFALLRNATGVDFRKYKQPTIHRRLQRRMVLHKLTRTEQYLRLLRERPAEVQNLYQDILIHVTRFFREPESFEAITSRLLPKIVQTLRDEQAIRVWIPGCSTGEEAYSIAIILLEYLDGATASIPVQVFATDISDAAIEHARSGVYSESIIADVSPERLRRFFGKVDGAYRISKSVRDLCIFARQDLTRDPPFSKLDMIVCRNVLIYMGPELQKRLMKVFHYALKSTGYLVLGGAETTGPNSELFGIADKIHRIYQKKVAAVTDVPLPLEYTAVAPVPGRPTLSLVREEAKGAQTDANRLIQERYAPPGVIIDENLQVVQFRGQTGMFLEPPPGDPSMHVLKMAREGLLHGLRAAIQEARRTRTHASRKSVRVRANGGWREVNIDVFSLAAGDRQHLLILFDEVTESATGKVGRRVRTPPPAPPVLSGRRDQHVTRLEEELATSRTYLQSIIQELEAANEELQSANEEVLSANEELQSTNEELDTAKEELQSTNEELNTVNEELHDRNDELSRLNSDLMNLLGSVQIAIVIIASDLRIRRFTPMAERVLNLLPGDIGRPIGHIKPNIDFPKLEEQIVKVIETVNPFDEIVRDADGRPYSLRIRPYKNADHSIEGAVLALFDVHGVPTAAEASETARNVADAIVQVVRQPFLVVDGDSRVVSVNDAFCRMFDLSHAQVKNRQLAALGNGAFNFKALTDRLETVRQADGETTALSFEHRFGKRDGRKVRFTAQRLDGPRPEDNLLFVTIEDTQANS